MTIKPLFSFLLLLCLSSPVQAEPTTLVVRVLAKDAKFIGTSMGGMKITVTDAAGQLLAQGNTAGGTGSTDKLVKEPKTRYDRLARKDDAHFSTSLDLDQPIRVTVSASGPLQFPQSAQTVSTSLWLIPGKHLDGDGLILELPGFVTESRLSAQGSTAHLTLTANMMCGCPIEQGGLWNADQYQVSAHLMPDDRTKLHKLHQKSLSFSETNQFSAQFDSLEPGSYRLISSIFDPKTGNAGVSELRFDWPIAAGQTITSDN